MMSGPPPAVIPEGGVRRRRTEHVCVGVDAAEQYLRERSEARVVAICKLRPPEERVCGRADVGVGSAAQIQRTSVISTKVKFQSKPVIQIVQASRSASAIQLLRPGHYWTRPEIQKTNSQTKLIPNAGSPSQA